MPVEQCLCWAVNCLGSVFPRGSGLHWVVLEWMWGEGPFIFWDSRTAKSCAAAGPTQTFGWCLPLIHIQLNVLVNVQHGGAQTDVQIISSSSGRHLAALPLFLSACPPPTYICPVHVGDVKCQPDSSSAAKQQTYVSNRKSLSEAAKSGPTCHQWENMGLRESLLCCFSPWKTHEDGCNPLPLPLLAILNSCLRRRALCPCVCMERCVSLPRIAVGLGET